MDDVSPFEPTFVVAVNSYWRFILVVVLVVTVPVALETVSRPKASSATASLTVADPSDESGARNNTVGSVAVHLRPAAGVHVGVVGSAPGRARARATPPLVEPGAGTSPTSCASASAANSNILSVSFSGARGGKALAGLRAVVGGYSDVSEGLDGHAGESNLELRTLSIAALDAQLAVLNNAPPSTANSRRRSLAFERRAGRPSCRGRRW